MAHHATFYQGIWFRAVFVVDIRHFYQQLFCLSLFLFHYYCLLLCYLSLLPIGFPFFQTWWTGAFPRQRSCLDVQYSNTTHCRHVFEHFTSRSTPQFPRHLLCRVYELIKQTHRPTIDLVVHRCNKLHLCSPRCETLEQQNTFINLSQTSNTSIHLSPQQNTSVHRSLPLTSIVQQTPPALLYNCSTVM